MAKETILTLSSSSSSTPPLMESRQNSPLILAVDRDFENLKKLESQMYHLGYQVLMTSHSDTARNLVLGKSSCYCTLPRYIASPSHQKSDESWKSNTEVLMTSHLESATNLVLNKSSCYSSEPRYIASPSHQRSDESCKRNTEGMNQKLKNRIQQLEREVDYYKTLYELSLGMPSILVTMKDTEKLKEMLSLKTEIPIITFVNRDKTTRKCEEREDEDLTYFVPVNDDDLEEIQQIIRTGEK